MPTDRLEVYIGPHGSHHGSGSRGYPVRELAQAIRLVRRRREPGQDAVIWVFPGTYRIGETLVLGPGDSRTTIAAIDGGEVVFDGAVRIVDWDEISLGGRRVWAAPAPERGFVSLYVDGERRVRPRWPRDGELRILDQAGLDVRGDFDGTLFDGADRFTAAADDLPELGDPTAVDVVVPHFWVQERMPIQSVDRSTGVVISTRRSIFALRDDATKRFARYWLDNVAEVFSEEPGEWYLDRTGVLTGASRLLYAPHPHESIGKTEITVPAIEQFVRVEGDALTGGLVRGIRIEGITFRGAGFDEMPAARAPFHVREDELLPRDVDFAASVQGATEASAAVRLSAARDCAFIGGGVERVDGYAIELTGGSRGNVVSGAHLRDLGAGAVRVSGDGAESSPGFSRANEVSDCHLQAGGRVYPNAVAVLFQHGAENVIAHNAIHDFFYTGISVGWSWDYVRNASSGNDIAFNHVYDIGHGVSTTPVPSTSSASRRAPAFAATTSTTSDAATTAVGGSTSIRARHTSSSRATWCTTAATRLSTSTTGARTPSATTSSRTAARARWPSPSPSRTCPSRSSTTSSSAPVPPRSPDVRITATSAISRSRAT